MQCLSCIVFSLVSFPHPCVLCKPWAVMWVFAVLLTSSLQCWPGLDTAFVYQTLFVRCCPTKGPDLPKPLNNTTSECCNILTLTKGWYSLTTLRMLACAKGFTKSGPEVKMAQTGWRIPISHVSVYRGEKPFVGFAIYAIFW